MTHEEHRAAILQLAQISQALTEKLDKEGQDLFEAYCTLYERVVIYENYR